MRPEVSDAVRSVRPHVQVPLRPRRRPGSVHQQRVVQKRILCANCENRGGHASQALGSLRTSTRSEIGTRHTFRLNGQDGHGVHALEPNSEHV